MSRIIEAVPGTGVVRAAPSGAVASPGLLRRERAIFAPEVVVAPAVVLAYAVVAHDGYHLAADHKDLVAYGLELAVVAVLIFVGGRLVAGRLFRST
jgi:hypothetical protein